MSAARFAPLTPVTAPGGAGRLLQATERHLGYLPDAAARMAASPQLLDLFLRATALFDATTLDPIARETVVMALANRAGCDVCRAVHTARLERAGAAPELVAALRAGTPIADPRLEAVRTFALALADGGGRVDRAAVDAFLAAGHGERQALEVVLGVGAYTLSTLANGMTGAVVDPPLRPHL